MKYSRTMHSRKNEQGIALITTLLFLTVMGLLSTTLVFTVQNEMRSSAAYKYNQQAFYVADAGIQKSLHWYRNSYTPIPDIGGNIYDTTQCPVEYNNEPVMLAGKTGYDSAFPDSGVISTFLNEFNNKTLSANEKNTGAYAVNATLVKHTPVTFLDLTNFTRYQSAIERWVVDSTGYWGSVNNPIGVVRIEAVIENNGNAIFDRGLWGIEELKAGGDIYVDSFDPTMGVWDPVNNKGYSGSVGSNGEITVSGDAVIDGDAVYGPKGSFTVNGGIDLSGREYQLPTPRVFPPVWDFPVGSGRETVPNVPINPGRYGSFRLGPNDTLQLNPGMYEIDSIDMISANAKIEVLGPVTLFVKSGFKLAGQGMIVPPEYDPADITVFYGGENEAVLVGGSRGYLDFYGPNAPVKLAGNTDFNGSFIGKTLDIMGGATVHFNEDGRSKNMIQRPFRILSWSQK